MDRFETMRIFVAVADAGGFAAAARRLSLSAPAVTRAVAALEADLGAPLLHRTTRVVQLTDTGTRFLQDARRILGELEQAMASAAGAHGKPSGTVAITASALFGRLFVAPIVLGFLTRYREVSARLFLIDRIVDLMEERLDVAIRIADLPSSSLTATRVGSVRRVVCGSPKYLAKHGVPKTPRDLEQFVAIELTSPGTARWDFVQNGAHLNVKPPSRLSANSTDVAIAAAIAGHGLTRALSYQVARELRVGKLRVVLQEYEPPPVPVHVVHREGRRATSRVRAFVDFAVDRLRAEPALGWR